MSRLGERGASPLSIRLRRVVNTARGWATDSAVVGLLAVVVCPGIVLAQSPGDRESPEAPDVPAETRPVGTMLELMEKIIYPTSNAVFYAGSRTPTDDAGWSELEADALILAESANLLMMPGRALDDEQWMRDARLMLDAGEAAFRAARERDVEALQALNDPLYQSCVTCHEHYDVQ